LNLPHRHPFRLVDRTADGRALLRVSANSVWSRGSSATPAVWLVEAVAQSAAILLAPGTEAGERRLALAAIESAEMTRAPEPGETVEIEVSLENRWGALVRVRGQLTVDGAPVGSAIVVLAEG
jgi:3-hydroxyacyl-[acyl-carrier-protein] dehydratase